MSYKCRVHLQIVPTYRCILKDAPKAETSLHLVISMKMIPSCCKSFLMMSFSPSQMIGLTLDYIGRLATHKFRGTWMGQPISQGSKGKFGRVQPRAYSYKAQPDLVRNRVPQGRVGQRVKLCRHKILYRTFSPI